MAYIRPRKRNNINKGICEGLSKAVEHSILIYHGADRVTPQQACLKID